MANLPSELLYMIFAVILLGIAAVLVPRQDIKRLFPAAIIAGSMVAFIFVFLFGKPFGLFKYSNYGPYHIFGVPFWLLLAWHPAILVFLHFLPKKERILINAGRGVSPAEDRSHKEALKAPSVKGG